MRTETTTIYIAYDGTAFDDKDVCEQYEKINLLGRLSSDCVFLDDDRYHVSIAEFFNNPENISGIYAPNVEQAKIIHHILDEKELESPWGEDDHFTPGFYWYNYNDKWENVRMNLTYWQNVYDSF